MSEASSPTSPRRVGVGKVFSGAFIHPACQTTKVTWSAPFWGSLGSETAKSKHTSVRVLEKGGGRSSSRVTLNQQPPHSLSGSFYPEGILTPPACPHLLRDNPLRSSPQSYNQITPPPPPTLDFTTSADMEAAGATDVENALANPYLMEFLRFGKCEISSEHDSPTDALWVTQRDQNGWHRGLTHHSQKVCRALPSCSSATVWRRAF